MPAWDVIRKATGRVWARTSDPHFIDNWTTKDRFYMRLVIEPTDEPPPWWDSERAQVKPEIEEIAHMIDPEAFGLPHWEPTTGTFLTDRDEARDKAAAILRKLKAG